VGDVFTLFTSRLDEAGVRSMVTGSVAAMVYGEPRLTHDIDIVIALRDADIDVLIGVFPEASFDCAPAEVIRVEARRALRGHFHVIDHETGYKAEFYLAGSDPLHRWALDRRRSVTLSSGTIHVAPPVPPAGFATYDLAPGVRDTNHRIHDTTPRIGDTIIEIATKKAGVRDTTRKYA
jgi:hypothetical protein